MKRLQKNYISGAVLMIGLLTCLSGYAQTADGNAGINTADTLVKSYFTAASNLLYAIGAIIGLIGAIRVYSMFNKHDPQLMSAAFTWFGGCIFLVVVAAVIQSFFGI